MPEIYPSGCKSIRLAETFGQLLENATNRMGWTHDRILQVARTIADWRARLLSRVYTIPEMV